VGNLLLLSISPLSSRQMRLLGSKRDISSSIIVSVRSWMRSNGKKRDISTSRKERDESIFPSDSFWLVLLLFLILRIFHDTSFDFFILHLCLSLFSVILSSINTHLAEFLDSIQNLQPPSSILSERNTVWADRQMSLRISRVSDMSVI